MFTARKVATGGIFSLVAGVSVGFAVFFTFPVSLTVAVSCAAGGVAVTALAYAVGATVGSLSAEVDKKSLEAEACERQSAETLSNELDATRLIQMMETHQARLTQLEAQVGNLQQDVEEQKAKNEACQNTLDTTIPALSGELRNLLVQQVSSARLMTVSSPAKAGIFSHPSHSAANAERAAQPERIRGIRTRTSPPGAEASP